MKLKLLILVLALQSAWVLGTVITQERALREGTGNPRGKLTVQAVVAASATPPSSKSSRTAKPYAEAMKDVAR